ncbi:protein GVQW3 [Trichonephila clavipes]|uniref:Protein GVQW3 n=1 Tax=Trichonephila clavipes TaxID=2585209 RepID=A0A8X6RWV2_TRICX|nr:protein GVQW3 [Trichonephila clavipes]
MCENTDQRICIKFCFKLGKTGTETYEMMKTAFGDEAISRARFFEWLRRFKARRQSVKSDPRSGRPSTSRNEDNIAQVKAVVHSYRCLRGIGTPYNDNVKKPFFNVPFLRICCKYNTQFCFTS